MPTSNEMFEFVTRHKIRFASSKGELSGEQLWDVPLLSNDGFNLDNIAKEANRRLKLLTEESFVNTGRTLAHEKAELTLEVVKYVIATKLAEEEAAKNRADNRAKKEKLLRILAEKQEGKLSELSEKEIQKQINALET